MSGARRAHVGTVARVALALALVGVVAFIVLRPSGSSDPDTNSEGGGGPKPSAVLPSATPATPPSEEAFCTGYRKLAAAQGQYAASPDERGAELLRTTADDLLATGVPDSMTAFARTGYLVELSGIYASLGHELDRRAVPGALEDDGSKSTSVTGSAGALDTWLSAFCPAW